MRPGAGPPFRAGGHPPEEVGRAGQAAAGGSGEEDGEEGPGGLYGCTAAGLQAVGCRAAGLRQAWVQAPGGEGWVHPEFFSGNNYRGCPTACWPNRRDCRPDDVWREGPGVGQGQAPRRPATRREGVARGRGRVVAAEGGGGVRATERGEGDSAGGGDRGRAGGNAVGRALPGAAVTPGRTGWEEGTGFRARADGARGSSAQARGSTARRWVQGGRCLGGCEVWRARGPGARGLRGRLATRP